MVHRVYICSNLKSSCVVKIYNKLDDRNTKCHAMSYLSSFFKTTHFMASQKNDLADFCDKNTLCDILVCKDAMFASCDLSSYLCAPVTNYLQKYHDTKRKSRGRLSIKKGRMMRLLGSLSHQVIAFKYPRGLHLFIQVPEHGGVKVHTMNLSRGRL